MLIPGHVCVNKERAPSPAMTVLKRAAYIEGSIRGIGPT